MFEELYELGDSLDKAGKERLADHIDVIIKEAGQIPAGMHRFILMRGNFGGSEYDSLDYEEDKEENEVED